MNNPIIFLLGFGLFALYPISPWADSLNVAVKEEDSALTEAYLLDDMIVDISRNVLIAPANRWPNGIVHYRISCDFDDNQVVNIKSAMAFLEAVSCIRFIEANKEVRNYVNIVSMTNGCNSYIGYRGVSWQKLNLSTNMKKCSDPVVIMHELLHTLGFYHEHMSPIRDEYIKVNWENIVPGKESAFTRLDNETVTDFGFGYDYESVMHYKRKGFSANGLETITPLDSEAVIGQRVGLSDLDILKLNAMYNCTM